VLSKKVHVLVFYPLLNRQIVLRSIRTSQHTGLLDTSHNTQNTKLVGFCFKLCCLYVNWGDSFELLAKTNLEDWDLLTFQTRKVISVIWFPH